MEEKSKLKDFEYDETKDIDKVTLYDPHRVYGSNSCKYLCYAQFTLFYMCLEL